MADHSSSLHQPPSRPTFRLRPLARHLKAASDEHQHLVAAQVPALRPARWRRRSCASAHPSRRSARALPAPLPCVAPARAASASERPADQSDRTSLATSDRCRRHCRRRHSRAGAAPPPGTLVRIFHCGLPFTIQSAGIFRKAFTTIPRSRSSHSAMPFALNVCMVPTRLINFHGLHCYICEQMGGLPPNSHLTFCVG